MARESVSLLKILKENNRRLEELPHTPRTKLEVLRLVNIRNRLRKGRDRLISYKR